MSLFFYSGQFHSLVWLLGIHPWFAEKTAQSHPEWEHRLLQLLKQFPTSFVGECGMDRVATDPITKQLYSWETQLNTFLIQWKLAAQEQRVVSVHVVQAQGWLLEFMRQQTKLSPDQWPLRISKFDCFAIIQTLSSNTRR